jgi:hypothetical protein
MVSLGARYAVNTGILRNESRRNISIFSKDLV